jgi:DNA-binding CsgD family transcriptional regulator
VLLRNGRYEDPQLSDRIRQLLANTPLQEEAVVLSVKEEQLVRLVAGGRSTREIASQLQVRTDTVRRRLSALYGKTGARNQGGLLVWGLEHGVLKQPDLACGLHQRPGQEQGAAAAEPWMEERPTQATKPTCVPNLSPLWDELSVVELRSLLRSYPIDRTSLPAAIERLRRNELIEALNQIQALGA